MAYNLPLISVAKFNYMKKSSLGGLDVTLIDKGATPLN